jgi:hypothetical protein
MRRCWCWHIVIGVGAVSAMSLSVEATEIFEKVVVPPRAVSPTGITTAPPAAARAAGWTIVAPESRSGLMERNPAFLADTAHGGLSITGGWEQRDDWGSAFDEDLTRLLAVTAEVRVAPVSLGFAYQMADRVDYTLQTISRNEISNFEELATWTCGIAFKPIPTLSVGASFTSLHKESPIGTVYRATLGTELQTKSLKVAAAFQSQQFGSDADALLAPSWLQLDARMPIGERLAVGARLSSGWWSDTRNGLLQSPFDPGVGGSYRVVPQLRVLAGVHHVRDRYNLPPDVPTGDSPLIRRGQGTYLDGGFVLDLPSSSHVALSIEDNHIDSSAPHTLITLSTGVVF